KGLAYYLEIVRTSREEVAGSLERDELGAVQRDLLLNALDELEYVEAFWGDLAELCAGLPETLVHGDLDAKNLILDPERGLVAVDWASAGWGTPAVDLREIDPSLYHAAVAELRPGVPAGSIERAAAAGRVLGQIARFRGVTAGLPAARTLRSLRDRQVKLTQALRDAGWG